MAGQFGKYGSGGGGDGDAEPAAAPPAPAPPAAPQAVPPAAPPSKAGKLVTIALIGLGVVAIGSKGKAWLDARRAPQVAVTCKPASGGVDCTVQHEVGPKANACFTVEVACGAGKSATGKACQVVDIKGKATTSVTGLAGWAECGTPGSVQVSEVKAVKAE